MVSQAERARKKKTTIIVVVLVLAVLGVIGTVATPMPPMPWEIAGAWLVGKYTVTFSTPRGDMVGVLDGKNAPLTVANFVKLARAKFYDGLDFHRVETDPNFSLIQGGDPKGDGSGAVWYGLPLEISEKLNHGAGAIAMARREDPNSAGCQFYICRSPMTVLDGKYAVFGRLVKGLDVANKIQKGDKITKITIREGAPALSADKSF